MAFWTGRLLSLFEAGQPYSLDPGTLVTQGLWSGRGAVRPGLPFDLGSRGANNGFSAFVRAVHTRLGTAALLPPELLATGGWRWRRPARA